VKLITVIARYNENLEWVKQLNTDVIIYNKGDDFNFEMPRTDVENKGRESETFCRFILEWYDALKDYDACVFLQGDPSGHFVNPVETINNYNSQEIIRLGTTIAFYEISSSKTLNNINNFTLAKILGKDIKTNYKLSENHAAWLELGSESEYLTWIIELCSLLRIDIPQKVGWTPGAQYIVPVQYILSKDIKWWEDLHLLHYIYMNDKTRSLPHIVERVWPIIWEHTT
jgi:hypothetical protein